MSKDDKEIVAAIRESLAAKVGRERYELWFGTYTQLLLEGDRLVVVTPTAAIEGLLKRMLRSELESAVQASAPRPLGIDFRVQPAAATNALDEQPEDAPQAAPATDGLSRQADGKACADANTTCRADASAGVDSARGPQRPPSRAGRQISSSRRFASLETFVVGESNRLAHTTAASVAADPGQVSPLLLYGPTGVGKTHLVEGIWSAVRRGRPSSPIVYLSAEQFTTYFIEAFRGSGLPMFRRKYRGVELLVIDDLQFFAGKRATLIELLHTIDALLAEGRQLVLTADRPPDRLGALGPELTARLQGGMVCRLDPPDAEVRLGIVRQLAAKMGLRLPADVEQYLVHNLTSHARELKGAVNLLELTSRAQGCPIVLPLAEAALADLIRSATRIVRLPDIERAVCDTFGLEPLALQSSSRSKQVSYVRNLAIWLARKHTRAPYSEIGEYFGRRRHSTAISAHKTVNKWVRGEASVPLGKRDWKIDEAIRRVEETLRAG